MAHEGLTKGLHWVHWEMHQVSHGWVLSYPVGGKEEQWAAQQEKKGVEAASCGLGFTYGRINWGGHGASASARQESKVSRMGAVAVDDIPFTGGHGW